jgi:uncharacterized protein (TIGR02145 family)
MLAVAIYIKDVDIKDVDTLEYNRIDLFDDEKISVTSSIQNINDISKTFTDFSQTFTVPASKQNNKIFRHWYDNSNDAPFSTLVKSDAYIEIDTIPFRSGKIQLESANLIDGQPQDYSITFIGILGNLKDIFAGKYLKDLTLDTSYDFNYSAENVRLSVIQTTTSTDIMFPLISSNRPWNVSSIFNDNAVNWVDAPIRYNELFPAIKLRAVLNMIETEFGINFDGTSTEPSNFLNTDARFTNAYLYLKNADTMGTKEDLTKVNFTSESGSSSLLTGYTVDLVNDKIINTTANASISGNVFLRKKITFIITPSVSGISYSIKINKNGNLIFDSGLLNSTSGVTYSKEIENTTNRIGTNDYFEFYIGTTQSFTFTTQVESVGTYFGTSGNQFRNFYGASQTTLSSYALQINQYFPEIKIEDFFSGLLKMFNLTCFSNDGINYTVEQLESYYGGGSDIDITKYVLQDKKALNRVKTYKKINFDYEKSESFINVDFNSRTGIEYGTLQYVNNPITEGEEYSVKLPFEDLNFSNLNGLFQVGYCLKTDLQKYIPKPIILYDYNPTNTTAAGFTFYWSNSVSGPGTGYTTYKAFGQETLISGTTYSLNFNEQQSTLTNDLVPNSLYNEYYSAYFANIYNLKARLVKVSAILPTSILTTLKLNDRLIIRDKRYLINTFTTDLTTGLVQFELLTDQRVVEPSTEVIIGTQIWTNRNLDVETYRDGTVIPEVTDPTAWAALTTGAWCYYANNTANGVIYGKLYNWYAVAGIDGSGIPRNLAPLGYHVPTDAEWTTLTTYLGGESVAGGKMKSTGTLQEGTGLWESPNQDATNESGFTGFPGGYRNTFGTFLNIGYNGFLRSSSEASTTNAWTRGLNYNNGSADRGNGSKKDGLSVRLIKD